VRSYPHLYFSRFYEPGARLAITKSTTPSKPYAPMAGILPGRPSSYLYDASPKTPKASRYPASMFDTKPTNTIQSVIVVGTYAGNRNRERAEIELDELEELARTLGAKVIGRHLLSLREPQPATYLRSGAVNTLSESIGNSGQITVLVNDPLTPRQQHNLEEQWDTTVLDRTDVILAIFGKRAKTAEGRLQVEMALLEHQLPRLAGGWTHLERQRGRVGMGGMRGGAGEKQIEVDRRLIRQRISALQTKLNKLEKQRQTQRSARSAVPLASCALVGYTNAGKSTLLNALTKSEVFATLDPTSRRLEFPSGRKMILTDTVGFIQSLPPELVEAFSATLEEVKDAHVLGIVVDASHPDAGNQLQTVLETLESMECNQPSLLIASKIDLVPATELPDVVAALEDVAGSAAIPISAQSGKGLSELKQALNAKVGEVVPDTASNRHLTA
jgi:GTP-binding protein HflX